MALERQREAAKRAAVLHLPTQKDGIADGMSKSFSRPAVTGATAPFIKPAEVASKALPRLKQAMEVRVTRQTRWTARSTDSMQNACGSTTDPLLSCRRAHSLPRHTAATWSWRTKTRRARQCLFAVVRQG